MKTNRLNAQSYLCMIEIMNKYISTRCLTIEIITKFPHIAAFRGGSPPLAEPERAREPPLRRRRARRGEGPGPLQPAPPFRRLGQPSCECLTKSYCLNETENDRYYKFTINDCQDHDS